MQTFDQASLSDENIVLFVDCILKSVKIKYLIICRLGQNVCGHLYKYAFWK